MKYISNYLFELLSFYLTIEAMSPLNWLPTGKGQNYNAVCVPSLNLNHHEFIPSITLVVF